jgi:glycosyltransferase involved in cell wall biosynthesis
MTNRRSAGADTRGPWPRLLFVGPALGSHPGWVTTQGEVLAGLFEAAGHHVVVSSDRLHPVGRAVDHAGTLVRRRRDVDVAVVSVFSGNAFALAEEAVLLCRLLGVPSVAWLHGGNLPPWGETHRRRVHRLLRRVDAVVAPSAYLARWAEGFGVTPTVIPNVLDLDGYQFRRRTPARPRLLWMRTFQDLYDPATAVRTLALLRERGIDATLTMAGQDKGLLGATRDLADALGVTGWISFPGFVSGSHKTRLLDAHDVFLNTNRVDNAPVTVLEAAASGLGVVSTAVGGIPDLLVADVAARLVPPGDAAAMAEAVAGLLDDPASMKRLTEAARRVAQASAWPAVRDRWVAVADSSPVRSAARSQVR